MDDLAKLLPVKEIYQDLAQPAARQVGEALGNVVQAARFFAAPIDYIAAYNQRWQRYLKRIAEKVPEDRRCVAVPQAVGPAMDGLRFVEEDGILAEMFLNLLAKAIDREQVEKAHPAFSSIVGQLSPDEAIVLWHLRKSEYLLRQSSPYNAATRTFGPRTTEQNDFPLGDLIYPDNYFLYFNHLNSLSLAGIWQQGNQEVVWETPERKKQTSVIIHSKAMLSDFGRMFADACVPDELVETWRPAQR